MNAVAITATETKNIVDHITGTQSAIPKKTLIICGICGAQEQAIEDNKTECPNCDEYIY